ncbi:MAG TPA: hypothetical protein VGK47_03715 [Nitrososphaeraceae archaeon]
MVNKRLFGKWGAYFEKKITHSGVIDAFCRPKVLFHGGCFGCTMQDSNGIEYCTGCKYFQCDWDLPDLNDGHKREEERMESIRQDALIKSLLK